MIRIALCDDEYEMYLHIKDLLSHYGIQHDVEFELKYFSTAIELLTAPFDYNILLLDLILEDKKDGIEVGRQLRKMGNTALFIITTSRTDKTLEGYKANVLRYLIKPITQDAFDEALFAVMESYRHNNRLFPVKFKQNTDYLHYEDIVLIESYLRKRYVDTPYERHQTTDTWPQILEYVKKELAFFQPQRSFVINLAYVKSSSKRNVTMTNDRIINFAKGKYEEFEKQLFTYLKTKSMS